MWVCVKGRRSETQALKTGLVGDELAGCHSAGKGVGGWTVHEGEDGAERGAKEVGPY